MSKFNRRLLLSAAFCALAAPAFAADIPVKAVPLPASVYNWTGVYIGAHVGYGKGLKDFTSSSAVFPVQGWLGGAQIGFNQQVGNFVFGIEADASWSDLSGSHFSPFGGPAFAPASILNQSLGGNSSIDRIVTVSGRLGFAQDRWLVYVKGGAAWLHENHDFQLQATGVIGGAPVSQGFAVSGSEDRFGAMLGFGSEFALWGNWSFKSEYNYIHLPTGSLTLSGTQFNLGVTTPVAYTQTIPQAIHLAKFGINYRFGPDAPPTIAPSLPAPGYNWTGAWVGVQAGYGFGRKTWTAFAPRNEYDVDGWIGGVSTGVNVQAGVFVAGIETEWLWSGIKGGRSDLVALLGGTQTQEIGSKVDWMSLNSVRLGFVAADRWLVYVKGGVALAKESHDFDRIEASPFGTTTYDIAGNALHTGYLAGIGVEHAVAGNWSVKLEYNYINFRLQSVIFNGTVTYNVPGTAVGTNTTFQQWGIDQDMHLVKFGISYRFTGLADVITARY